MCLLFTKLREPTRCFKVVLLTSLWDLPLSPGKLRTRARKWLFFNSYLETSDSFECQHHIKNLAFLSSAAATSKQLDLSRRYLKFISFHKAAHALQSYKCPPHRIITLLFLLQKRGSVAIFTEASGPSRRIIKLYDRFTKQLAQKQKVTQY